MRVPQFWYTRNLLAYLLWPLSQIYCLLFYIHYFAARFQKKITLPTHVKIIVVGNVTVGGAGKTPTVLWLIEAFQSRGFQVGVVSRGYGRLSKGMQTVSQSSLAEVVGDEPLMIHQRTQVPVVVGEDRPKAALTLLEQHPEIDLIISDDGLTHYALPRHAAVLVIEGKTRFGNGFMLPAGPLRAPQSIQKKVTAKLCLGGTPAAQELSAQVHAIKFINVKASHKTLSVDAFQGKICYAVAGLALPNKFFDSLRALGITIIEKAFPDHHLYTKADFDTLKDYPILMTEKDAVKCKDLNIDQAWYLLIRLEADMALLDRLIQRIGV